MFAGKRRQDRYRVTIQITHRWRIRMRPLLPTLLLSIAGRPLFAQGAPPQAAANPRYTRQPPARERAGEEQRRFEILIAHWDVPITDITPSK